MLKSAAFMKYLRFVHRSAGIIYGFFTLPDLKWEYYRLLYTGKEETRVRPTERLIFFLGLVIITATVLGITRMHDTLAVSASGAISGLDNWPGNGSESAGMGWFQNYITPDDNAVIEAAKRYGCVENAYRAATNWVYVSEQTLNGVPDLWLSPREFLTGSPEYSRNPVPGEVAGDCEEQANTLVSIFRALGVPPEQVRVVLGYVNPDNEEKGHVWVELLSSGQWLALDPSSGPRWDDAGGTFLRREGLPFDYFTGHGYPVTRVSTYYNDEYRLDAATGEGNAPEWW